MLKVLKRARGSRVLLALFALSAFLLCTLPAHHAKAEMAAASGSAKSAVAATSATGTDAGSSVPGTPPGADAVGAQSHGGHGHDSDSAPHCHVVNSHVMDVVNRFVPSSPGDVLGLVAVLLVACLGGLRLGTQVRAQWWATRPSRPLAGVPLLISLGISRT
ncbi:hypothetical protein [Saccharopolyspora sp. SCSIO 74807]|uniref:hypothetical protein n=1 Tax=Saccharopolyspora sp. SCSIO 74807 TaxID=3118084 RepID=UPI0030CDCDCD